MNPFHLKTSSGKQPHVLLNKELMVLNVADGSAFSVLAASFLILFCCLISYDIVVDVVPKVNWVSEDAYKKLKVVVEMDHEVTAEKASEIELKRRLKSLGAMKIVTDRGLQIGDVVVLDIFATTINEDNSTGDKIPSADTKG